MGGGERMVKRHPTEEHEGRGSVSAVVKVGTRDKRSVRTLGRHAATCSNN